MYVVRQKRDKVISSYLLFPSLGGNPHVRPFKVLLSSFSFLSSFPPCFSSTFQFHTRFYKIFLCTRKKMHGHHIFFGILLRRLTNFCCNPLKGPVIEDLAIFYFDLHIFSMIFLIPLGFAESRRGKKEDADICPHTRNER